MTPSKKAKVGGDVDAYCTKCRMDLSHRVVAMVGEAPKRVKCLTCQGEHNYRKPMAERDAPKASASPRAGTASRPPRAARSSAPKAERSARATWEKAIAGQPAGAFQNYSTRQLFDEGDLVRHSKFGDGVVYRVIDVSKVEILFEDGAKTMAHNLQA